MINKKPTLLQYAVSRLKLTLVAALLFAAVAIAFTPVVAWAQNDGDAGPRCAVVNYGEVACPINVGQGTKDCFIRDPGNVEKPYEFVKGDCNDKAFTKPAAVSCDPDKVPESAKYCDQAVQCANGTQQTAADKPNCDLVKKYINPMIMVVSALVGIGVTISIIYGGIQYASSADDPGKVSAAKQRILNSLLVLVGYGLFYVFLNWIIPGGV